MTALRHAYRWPCVLAFIFALLDSHAGFAQENARSDLTDISIEELTHVQVYSASRHLEYSEDAPSAVSVITAEEIRSYGWRTLGDALRSVRGFYTAYDRDYVYLGVRGVLQPGNYNSHILLLINGHRLNDNVYDSAHLGTEFPLDLELVERIEIVRGPNSSLFGTNAIFGIINVVTRRVSHGVSIEIAGESASWLGRAGRLTASFQKGKLTGLMSGSVSRTGGHEALYFPEFDSPTTNFGLAQGLDGDAYTHEFADIQYGRFRLQGLFSDRTKHVPTAPFGTEFNTPTTSNDQRAYIDLGYHRPITSNSDLDLRTYLDHYQSRAQGTAAGNEYVPATHGSWEDSAEWLGTEAMFAEQLGRHRFTVGGQYEHSFHVRQRTQAEGAPPVVNEDDPQRLAAVYTQAELKLISHLAVNAGLRYDWFSTYGGSVSPRVAFVYSLGSKTSIKYIFGRAFRAPNAYENWYDDGYTRERPNPPLHSEKIQSQDVVVERKVNSWLKLTSEFFYNRLSNLIDQSVDPLNGRMVFQNGNRFKARGFGAEAEVSTKAGIKGRFSYLLGDADDSTGRELPNKPVSSIKANAFFPVRRADVGVEVLHFGSETTSQGVLIRDSTITNLTVSTRPIRKAVEFSVSCYNVFNQSWYSPPAAYEPRIRMIAQDGRSFRFRVAYRFSLLGK